MGHNIKHDIYSKFGAILAKTREAAGLTQQDLANAIGLSRTSITNIEKGRQGVSIITLYELSEVLKVKPERLLPDAFGLEDKLEKHALTKNEIEWVQRVISSK